MRRIILLSVFVLCCHILMSNNIRVSNEAKVVGFCGTARDTAIVEFDISWENSWRDDFNWDAAWIFLKYKKQGVTELWHHAYLTREGNEVLKPDGSENNEFSFMFGEIGQDSRMKVTGLFLNRNGIGEGDVQTKIRIKWPLKSNDRQKLTATDFGDGLDKVQVAAYAVEMVYIPAGAYFLGDNFSNGSFKKVGTGRIPPVYDLLDNVSGYIYTTKTTPTTGNAANMADRINQPVYPDNTLYFIAPTHWQVDFGAPKEIRYFGISGASNFPECTPSGTWYLKASNDGTIWNNVYSGDYTDWSNGAISYPVQKSLKVRNPGAYRYYRIEISGSRRNDGGIVMQNVAMSSEELYPNGSIFSVESEEPVVLGSDLIGSDGKNDWTGTLSKSYPKGFRGYYIMKYEVSQQQYVEFLNALTRTQQQARVGNNDFYSMESGNYVFGPDLKRPDNRNGIVYVMSKGQNNPLVFGNNLNPANPVGSADDGQTIACNYLSPADMMAYCDWSGLRPMSEMEYEKACRRPYPQFPENGEYAWNSASGIKRLASLSDLKDGGTEKETPADYQKNVNGGTGTALPGPVRCGTFSNMRTSQQESGGTYWGVMEMSGNLWEMCYNANAAGRTFVADNADNSHGDGYITESGTDVSSIYWPNNQAAIAIRGGSFESVDNLLRTSDRTNAAGSYFRTLTQREKGVGFRGVRSILNTSGFTAGTIACQNGLQRDTACAQEYYIIQGEPAQNTIGKTTYAWFFSKDNGVSWNMINGATGITLSYDFNNAALTAQTMLFKRKAICAVGEETTSPVTVIVSPTVTPPDIIKQVNPGLGYPFNFPCPPLDNVKCKWEDPGGFVREELAIDPYTVANDGIYKVCYENQMGCESKKVNVTLKGVDEIRIVNYGTYRAWSDGTYAKSACAYVHPEAPYVYRGDTGSGVYRIDPDGVEGSVRPFDIYCDMETTGGGWMLVMMGANSSTTFNYSSPYWTNDVLLNEKQINIYANQDMKNQAFTTCPLEEIFIKVKLGANNRTINFFETISKDNCRKLFDKENVFISSQYTIDQIVNNYDLDKLYGYRWQRGEPKVGFSISGGYQGGIHVRYGIIANQTGENNATHDSEIGIGTTRRGAGAHSLVNDNNLWVTGDFGGSFWFYVRECITDEEIILVNKDTYRCWSDGTYAKSGSEYRNPVPPYKYKGAIGSGFYRIDPDGPEGPTQPFDVYCDMETNGGGWMLTMMGANNSTTFNYNSPYWTNDALLNENQTSPDANQDMKNRAYIICPVEEIFVKMKLSANDRVMNFFETISKDNCKKLFDKENVFISSQYTIDQIVNNYDLDKLYGYRWQRGEPKVGFSISGGYQGGIHVRYGIIANQTGENNATHDSEIGIGTTRRGAGAHSLVNDNNLWVTGDFGGKFWLYIRNKIGQNFISIVNNGKYRAWSDGTYARSASEYKNPPSGFSYTGSVGDGVYRIDPDGPDGPVQPFDIYCDMNTNGGGWMLVMMGASDGNTFQYSSSYWTDDRLLNEKQMNPNINQDMKNMGYLTIPVKQMFVRMKLAKNGKSRDFFEIADQKNCKDLFNKENVFINSSTTISSVVSSYDLNTIYGYPWQTGRPKVGFSIRGGYLDRIHLRYGIISNQAFEENDTYDSEVGIGKTTKSAGAWAGYNNLGNVCPVDFGGSFWIYVK